MTSEGHVGLDELADAAEGLVDQRRADAIEEHLAGCARCRADADALAEVDGTLAAAPPLTMPDDVFARLQGVVVGEQRRRAEAEQRAARRDPVAGSYGNGSGRYDGDRHRPHGPYGTGGDLPGLGGRFPKPHLADQFSATVAPRHRRARFAAGAAAAALLASAVGFGGYVLSASAGTAEPPSDQPVVLNQNTLGATASRQLQHGDLNAYRFTRAWLCVRTVTEGRITGIRSSVLDGQSGYLVIVHRDDTVRAVFVSGCDSGDPQAGPSATIGRG